MNILKQIETVCKLEVPQWLPVFCLSQEFDARYAGLTYSEYIRDAETIVEAQLRVIEHFGWDWAWLHLDDTLEFEALGVGVAAGENIVRAGHARRPYAAAAGRDHRVARGGRR